MCIRDRYMGPEKTYDNYYHDYWLFIDFYYTDTEEIVHTWTRPDLDAKVTTFAFVGLNDKLINRDYWFIANRKEIHKFLSLIHISEPTRLGMISYAVFCLKKKKKKQSLLMKLHAPCCQQTSQ
eukprot:TRINITY_DN28359_c0_g1_i1.p2 TRINITY_DN28359_c0_g1~~TRINITY_DN28359_c0_g1_i1.p2  ORF type:complete len:123 (-),score=13.30 TRINITY_DN28359_c0_g1_i1:13-381(-)